MEFMTWRHLLGQDRDQGPTVPRDMTDELLDPLPLVLVQIGDRFPVFRSGGESSPPT